MKVTITLKDGRRLVYNNVDYYNRSEKAVSITYCDQHNQTRIAVISTNVVNGVAVYET